MAVPPDHTSDHPRPTLVVNNGSDGTLSGVWCEVADGALERGYNVVLFDGPGQQSMLFERDVPFRHDWEKVLTPVVDFLAARPDVDADRLALYGVSQAGYWVLRAAAFEYRFAAVVADGGVLAVGRGWFEKIPAELLDLYTAGRKDEFDEIMRTAMAAPSADAARQAWAFRARPYGVDGYSAVLDEVARYDLSTVAQQITSPTLILDPDGEQFFPGSRPAPVLALGACRKAERPKFDLVSLVRNLQSLIGHCVSEEGLENGEDNSDQVDRRPRWKTSRRRGSSTSRIRSQATRPPYRPVWTGPALRERGEIRKDIGKYVSKATPIRHGEPTDVGSRTRRGGRRRETFPCDPRLGSRQRL